MLALLIGLAQMFPGGRGPVGVGDTPAAMLSAAACADCHPDEHREWAGSRHAQAWTNGIFQREYRQKPGAWCVHCHAPLEAQHAQVGTGGPLLAEGVNCATCHVRDGRIHARTQRPDSPHETVTDDAFGGPDWCGGCHEFTFPVLDGRGELVRYTPHPMQATVAQFRAGPHARDPEGCRGCHAASPGQHAYPGAHDPRMLLRALAFDVCRAGDDVVMTVANVGAGHDVPTGDVHRHLLARAWRPTAPEAMFEAFLGRRYAPQADGGKRTIWDSGLPPGTRRTYRVPLAQLGDDGGPLSFELRYVYTGDEFPRAGRDPGEPTWRVVHEQRSAAADLPPCD